MEDNLIEELYIGERLKIEGVAINRESNIINLYYLHKNDNNIECRFYNFFTDLKSAKKYISEININRDQEISLITEYICIPKNILNVVFIDLVNNKYEVLILTKNNDKFLVSMFDDKKKAEILKRDIEKIIKTNRDFSMEDVKNKIQPQLQSQQELIIINDNISTNSTEISTNNLDGCKDLLDNKRKKKIVEYDELPLYKIDIIRITNYEIFSKIVEEVIDKIKINEEYGITLLDITKVIHDKIDQHKGKRLNNNESHFVLNKLREKFPGRLFKRGLSYSIFDVTLNKYTTVTTVFGGLLFDEKPKKLPKAYVKQQQ